MLGHTGTAESVTGVACGDNAERVRQGFRDWVLCVLSGNWENEQEAVRRLRCSSQGGRKHVREKHPTCRGKSQSIPAREKPSQPRKETDKQASAVC